MHLPITVIVGYISLSSHYPWIINYSRTMVKIINKILAFLVLAGFHRSIIPPISRDWSFPHIILSEARIEMIYIPSGDFLMGSESGESGFSEDEIPQHSVYLDGYWISMMPVTNGMYNACIKAGKCRYSASTEVNPRFIDEKFSDHPVVYINWSDAQRFCKWIGGRLPTEAQWEKAARGPDGWTYPWGDMRPNMHTTNAKNMVGDTTKVGMFAEDRSYYGLYDMGGNVREWVFDWYDADYYDISPKKNPKGPPNGEKKVLKGGSWGDVYRFTRAANRLTHVPTSPGNNRGFRCVVLGEN